MLWFETTPMTVATANQWCCTDAATAEKLQRQLPTQQSMNDTAELFKILGDPTRLRLLMLLQSEPLCVRDLSTLLGMHQTAVSHQLKVLRHNRLVTYRREGKMSIYSLNDGCIEALIRIGRDHVEEGCS